MQNSSINFSALKHQDKSFQVTEVKIEPASNMNNTLNKSTSSQIDDDFNQRLESYFIDIELQKVVQKDTSNQSILSHEAEIEAEQNQSFEDEMQRTQYQLMKKIMETITQVDFLMIAEYMHKPMAYSLTVREHIQQETNLFIRDLKQ